MKNANKQYSKLNNEYELTFKDNGTFDLCEDDADIPTITYNFVSISDLGSVDKEHVIDIIGQNCNEDSLMILGEGSVQNLFSVGNLYQ